MLTQYNLKMPHAVYGGENAMDNITAIIKARGAKKVAMFTDKGIEGAGLFALPEEAVKASGAEYYVLDELPPEPSYMAVQKLVDEFKVSGADLIVACGGGSVMDAAKLASVLVTDAYGVKELLDNPGMAQKCVPIVLIPTTAGTGAEVTPNAIVAVPEKELKVGIGHKIVLPAAGAGGKEEHLAPQQHQRHRRGNFQGQLHIKTRHKEIQQKEHARQAGGGDSGHRCQRLQYGVHQEPPHAARPL